jgi:hypothetical protein
MGEKAHTEISQYKRVLKKMSDVPSLGGVSAQEIVSGACSALLQLNIVISNCEDFGIPFESLFNICGEEFLNKYLEDLRDQGVDGSTGLRDLLDKVCRYMKVNTSFREGVASTINIQLVVDAHYLFTRRFDILMSEIENATILEEIKLEKMKYETINSEQLKFTYRNSYITLVGLLLTALLTVANIIVTSIKDQK